ncbi:ribonuclease Z [Vallicoccus soli]|uniref:ribonuclease Z n=1 Tax=Vallicoccus soli TaxID=2339232 RepID=UPI001C49B535|nr:ribonuclease Z [Vallicoccus soli]
MRELVVLGTASQAPTRTRNHNGYVLRWDDASLLLDPGEGTQRQMLLAGVASPSLHRVCITHAHGDHCLGLAGVVQRLSLDRAPGPVDLHFPAAAQPYVTRLRTATAFHETCEVVEHPVDPAPGALVEVGRGRTYALSAASLDHRVPTVGWRVDEPDGRTFLPERLAAAGVGGPAVGELARAGSLRVGGRTVRVEDVSVPRAGQSFGFVMDTRPCDGAALLARGVDLLVCESTFLHRDAALADEHAHLTARQAGELAAAAGARRLVLTHFSQRYGHGDAVDAEFAAEASAAHPDVVVARDLSRVPVPRRRLQGHRRGGA